MERRVLREAAVAGGFVNYTLSTPSTRVAKVVPSVFVGVYSDLVTALGTLPREEVGTFTSVAVPPRVLEAMSPARFEKFCMLSDATKKSFMSQIDNWLNTNGNVAEFTEEAFMDAIGLVYNIYFVTRSETWNRSPNDLAEGDTEVTVVVMYNSDGRSHFIAVDPDSATARDLYKNYKNLSFETGSEYDIQAMNENGVATGSKFLCFFYAWLAFEEGKYTRSMKARARDRKFEAATKVKEVYSKYKQRLRELKVAIGKLPEGGSYERDLKTQNPLNEYVLSRKLLAYRRLKEWADKLLQKTASFFATRRNEDVGLDKLDVSALVSVGGNDVWDEVAPSLLKIAFIEEDRDRFVHWCKLWAEVYRENKTMCEKLPFWSRFNSVMRENAVLKAKGAAQAIAQQYAKQGLKVSIMVAGNPARPGGSVMNKDSTGFDKDWSLALRYGRQEENIMQSWLRGVDAPGIKDEIYASDSGAWRKATETQKVAFFATERTNYVAEKRSADSVTIRHRKGGDSIEVRLNKPLLTIENLEEYVVKKIGAERKGGQWGRENKTTTRQGYDYSVLNEAAYDMAFECRAEPIMWNGEVFESALVFAFGPNVVLTERPKVTDYDFDTNYEEFRTCVKAGLRAAMLKMAEVGVNVGVLAKLSNSDIQTKRKLENEYEEIVAEIINEHFDALRGMIFILLDYNLETDKESITYTNTRQTNLDEPVANALFGEEEYVATLDELTAKLGTNVNDALQSLRRQGIVKKLENGKFKLSEKKIAQLSKS